MSHLHCILLIERGPSSVQCHKTSPSSSSLSSSSSTSSSSPYVRGPLSWDEAHILTMTLDLQWPSPFMWLPLILTEDPRLSIKGSTWHQCLNRTSMVQHDINDSKYNINGSTWHQWLNLTSMAQPDINDSTWNPRLNLALTTQPDINDSVCNINSSSWYQ